MNVREYYEDKTGEMKPGKKVRLPTIELPPTPSECISLPLTLSKGISLSIEQYQALVGLVPSINEQLRKHGVALDAGAVENDGSTETGGAGKKAKKSTAEARKSNIEATSDEDED